MNYALIKNNIVENMIELHPANASDFPNAIAADPAVMGGVGIGDEYRDGRFYHDGQLIKNAGELAQDAVAEMADMHAALEHLGVIADG